MCTVQGAMRFQEAGKKESYETDGFFPLNNDKWEAGTLMDTIKCHPASANIFAYLSNKIAHFFGLPIELPPPPYF